MSDVMLALDKVAQTDLTPVELLFLDIAIILILARLLGLVARRFGQPPVVGEIVAGILLGPTLFSGEHTAWLFLGHSTDDGKGHVKNVYDMVSPTGLLTSLATVGLVLFMFVIGYEVDRKLFQGREKVAVTVSLGSILLPMVGGTALGFWLYNRHDDIDNKKLATALFVGAAMSVTAFPVLARILTDRRMNRTRIGSLAIASAAVDDIAAWSLLAIVVGIAGNDTAGNDAWHIALAPVYLAIMFIPVRQLLLRLKDRFHSAGRLTPDMLSIVVVLLVGSCFATEWLGVHYIFGAFIMGGCMPRQAGEALRRAILDRLEQISVLVLLPVFFVVSGVRVDLSNVDSDGWVELLAILATAIGGKFVGAYFGARAVGQGSRQAGALATLMNTRGLTEIVILNVGLTLGVLDTSLFSLMVVMALVTTVMTGPLLSVIYPKRLIDRDIADAERALGGSGAVVAWRAVVVVSDMDNTDLIDTGVDLAAARRDSEVLLVRLLPQKKTDPARGGAGLGQDLLAMTQTLTTMHKLAARGSRREVPVRVHVKYAEGELADAYTEFIVASSVDVVVIDPDIELTPHDFMPRVLRQVQPLPAVGSAVVVDVGRGGTDANSATQTASAMALSRGLELVITGGSRAERMASDITKFGINARVGAAPVGAIVVGHDEDATGLHILARGRIDEDNLQVADWATKFVNADAIRPSTELTTGGVR